MKWFLKMIGIKSKTEKRRAKLIKLQEKACNAQRNGDLRLAGKYLAEAELLETLIAEESGD